MCLVVRAEGSAFRLQPSLLIGRNRRVESARDVPAERATELGALTDALGRATASQPTWVVESADYVHGSVDSSSATLAEGVLGRGLRGSRTNESGGDSSNQSPQPASCWMKRTSDRTRSRRRRRSQWGASGLRLASSCTSLGRFGASTPDETGRPDPDCRARAHHQRQRVRRDAGSAGVTASGHNRSVFSVLPGHLADASCPDLLHARSVGRATARRDDARVSRVRQARPVSASASARSRFRPQ